MRLVTSPALAALTALLLTACATTHEQSSTVALGPHGRAEGRLTVPAGSEARLELEAEGPGPAWFVIRGSDGASMSEGRLANANAVVRSTEPEKLTIVLESGADTATSVAWEVRSSGAAMQWDLSGAQRAER